MNTNKKLTFKPRPPDALPVCDFPDIFFLYINSLNVQLANHLLSKFLTAILRLVHSSQANSFIRMSMQYTTLTSPHGDIVHDIAFDCYGNRFASCSSD